MPEAFPCVLVLAGVELTLFLVAGTVLCFGFSVLLSSAYLKDFFFQFPMLCQQAGVQEAGREHSRGSWPELAKGVFHTIERHAPVYILGMTFYGMEYPFR